MEPRSLRTHLTMDGKPKKGFTEKDAIYLCYRINTSQFSIHQMVAYKCASCGKFHIGHSGVILTDEKRNDYKNRIKKLKLYGIS